MRQHSNGDQHLLQQLLQEKRDAIHQRWVQLVLDGYPPESAERMRREPDPFTNPVGTTTVRETGRILDGIIDGTEPASFSESLEALLRIRAVQEFPPSQAAGLAVLLKRAIRDELMGKLRDDGTLRELLDLESRIDEVGLRSFDLYMACRERIFQIRLSEYAGTAERALERMNRRVEGVR